MTRMLIETSPEQASAVSKALDLYSRLAMGQFEEIASLVARGELPVADGVDPVEAAERLRALLLEAKEAAGHARNGHLGLGPHLPAAVRRAYEIQKTVDSALAELRDPHPAMRTVDYDGITVRYTDDPLPAVRTIP